MNMNHGGLSRRRKRPADLSLLESQQQPQQLQQPPPPSQLQQLQQLQLQQQQQQQQEQNQQRQGPSIPKRQSTRCTSCIAQGFECSGDRPICSQCYYSSSAFTASFGSKDKSMCSYPVLGQNGSNTQLSVTSYLGKRPRMLERNLAADVDVILRKESISQPYHPHHQQQQQQQQQHVSSDFAAQGDTILATSSWIERKFAHRDYKEPPEQVKGRRKNQIVGDSSGPMSMEDVIEAPSLSDHENSTVVLGLRPTAMESLEYERTRALLNPKRGNIAKLLDCEKLTAKAIEQWALTQGSSSTLMDPSPSEAARTIAVLRHQLRDYRRELKAARSVHQESSRSSNGSEVEALEKKVTDTRRALKRIQSHLDSVNPPESRTDNRRTPITRLSKNQHSQTPNVRKSKEISHC
ncbi:hypothetical protein BGZ94_005114, partial [Podila epigama]